MGKECPECRLVEEEYTRAAAEELTHDALLLKLASLQVLLDKQSHERGVASRRMEQAQSSRTKLSKAVKELKHQLVTERNFTDSYIRRLHESENKRRDAQALLERALDSSSEGSWMARALDAERELATFKAECLHLRELRDSIDNLRLLRSSCPDSNDGDFRVHLSEKEWDMVTHLMDTCKNKG